MVLPNQEQSTFWEWALCTTEVPIPSKQKQKNVTRLTKGKSFESCRECGRSWSS